jgi:cytochrome c
MKIWVGVFASFLIGFSVITFNPRLDTAYAANGNIDAGSRVYRACAACHSLTPSENLTGPSLAHIWHRKAGTLDSFKRYSSALVWDDKTLDRWIADPHGPRRLVGDGRANVRCLRQGRPNADLA